MQRTSKALGEFPRTPAYAPSSAEGCAPARPRQPRQRTAKRKRNRKPGNIESPAFLDLDPGLKPVTWPKDSDVRARILTPEIKSTPMVGWIDENLHRSKNENGWCLELDPGEGEYVVFYRFHPKR